MLIVSYLSTPLLLSIIIFFVSRACIRYIQYERMRKQFRCPPHKRYPSRDPILGLDYVWAMVKALKENRFLDFQKETYRATGGKAWAANFLGNRMVYTADAENIKALSTHNMDAFAIEPVRVGNGAITPYTGRGVSSSDGQKWQWSRDLVKPYFDRGGFANVRRLAPHVDRLICKIPLDGSTVDMQELFQRWVCEIEEKKLFSDLCLERS